MGLSFQIGSHTFPIYKSSRKYSFLLGFNQKKIISTKREGSRYAIRDLHIELAGNIGVDHPSLRIRTLLTSSVNIYHVFPRPPKLWFAISEMMEEKRERSIAATPTEHCEP